MEGGIHSCCDDPLHVAFAERMRYYHLGRLLSLGCPVSWRWLTAAPSSMGRALSDPMMRDGLRVRLGLPLVRCVGAEAGQPGPFGPRLMDTLGVGFRIDPNYGKNTSTALANMMPNAACMSRLSMHWCGGSTVCRNGLRGLLV